MIDKKQRNVHIHIHLIYKWKKKAIDGMGYLEQIDVGADSNHSNYPDL